MAECRLSLQEQTANSLVRLRVRLNDAQAIASLLNLPEARQYRRGADTCSFWLGPDQWLLRSDSRSAQDLIDSVNSKLADRVFAIIDSSDALAVFQLSGQSARRILAMGCGLDFSSGEFSIGRCASTRFAGVQLVVALTDDEQFDLFIDRSYSHYLQQWIANAARDPVTQVVNQE